MSQFHEYNENDKGKGENYIVILSWDYKHTIKKELKLN